MLARRYCFNPAPVGKSILLRALALARATHAERFNNEPQECYFLAHTLVSARRIHAAAWRWAEENGLNVKKAMGVETMQWPDGSHWTISSLNAIYGASGHLVLLDEAWDVPAEVVHNAIIPTMVEREQSQLWMFSTANDESTNLMTEYRHKAVNHVPDTMIAEWSAPPDADLASPDVWAAASPHWSKGRERLIAAAQGTPSLASQWLNIWPSERLDGAGHEWPEGWSRCLRPPAFAPTLAAIEVNHDRSRYGITAAARLDDGRVGVRCTHADSIEDAQETLATLNVPNVLVGISIKDSFPGPWTVHPVGQKETRQSTPLIIDLVRRGRVAHNHDPVCMAESKGARTSPTELGPILSARKSDGGSVAVIKSALWAVYGIESDLYKAAQIEIW